MVLTRALIASAFVVWVLAFTFSARAYEPPAAVDASLAAVAFRQAADAQATAPTDEDCQACHDDESAERADGTSVAVRTAVFEKSLHADLGCIDCHADLAKTTEWPHPEKLAKVDCSACHEDAVTQYRTSAHATAREAGQQAAATCVDCHGAHDVQASANPESRTYHLNIAATCGRCHGNEEIIARGALPRDLTRAFADSIHGQALSQSGLVVAPTCSSCHGAHDIRDPNDPASAVSAGKLPSTCGRCHEGIRTQFEGGVHGKLLARGEDGGPACQTCHTAHSIQPGETAAWQLSVIQQCGTCHAERMASFKDTFHGQVTALGSRVVAGCADCHGAHRVLPARDPASPIAPGNLVKTCGKCHTGANENFVRYDPHADATDRQRNPALYYTSRFMSLLLAAVFGFFGVHTSLWFTRELKARRDREQAEPRQAARNQEREDDGRVE